MRSHLVTAFSSFLVSLGFVSVIWVASSLVGQARSQTPDMQALPSAGAQDPQAPSMDLPPMDDSTAPLSPQTVEQALTQEYAPSSNTTEGYVYDPTGRRDPFRPSLEGSQIMTRKGSGPEVIMSSDPLQALDVGQYKIVGILWDIKNPRAVVKDPGGKTYQIKKDTKIGRNNGFVSMIREGAVLVVEPAYADNGMQTAVTRVLLLAK